MIKSRESKGSCGEPRSPKYFSEKMHQRKIIGDSILKRKFCEKYQTDVF